MPILPVLDVMHGLVVRCIAGKRTAYRPIVTTLCSSSTVALVARSLGEHFGFREFYLADLDAIAGAAPAAAIYDLLHEAGYSLWVDAGVRSAADACRLAALAVERVVVGLETVEGPDALAASCRDLGSERVVFSLDLMRGSPLGKLQTWLADDAEQIVRRAVDAGVTRLLVLDLADVGMGAGTGTEGLCTRLHAAYPHLSLAAGGGVRNAADVIRLYGCGVTHALIASALHERRLSCDDIAGLQRLP